VKNSYTNRSYRPTDMDIPVTVSDDICTVRIWSVKFPGDIWTFKIGLE